MKKTPAELNEMALKLMQSQTRKPIYDFGWNLTEVPEPNDERKENR